MAIRTTSASTGGGNFNPGWQEVTVSKAKYGEYSGNKFIDVWFEEINNEHMNLRKYEAYGKESGEEFAVANLFKLANAGILDKLDDPNGKKPIIRFDDDAGNLVGKRINIFLYKNEEGWFRILSEIAPTTQDGEVLSYTDDDTEYWKKRAEKYWNDYKRPSNDDDSSFGQPSEPESSKEVKTNDDNFPF